MTIDAPAAPMTAAARMALLAHASPRLSASLDPRTILDTLQQLIVPSLASGCLVDLPGTGGEAPYRRLASIAPADPRQLGRLFSALPRALPCIPQAMLIADADEPERWPGECRSPALRSALRTSDFRSLVIVPLTAREQAFGTLLCGRWRGARPYTEEDLALAADLAHRAAIALDHAYLYRRALRANDAREAMLSIVSHDLQAPLSAIGMSTVALRSASVDPTVVTIADTIDDAVQWMHRLIHDLLDMSMIEAGRLTVLPQATDLMVVMAKAAKMFEPEAAARGITLAWQVPDECPRVWADAARLGQVLVNLLSNAVKFTSAGGTVILQARPEPDGLRVEVRDTGSGIAPDRLPHVFDRFANAATASGVRGTGLGLAIAQSIMSAHGSRIIAESELGTGSRFHFRLAYPPPAGTASPTPA